MQEQLDGIASAWLSLIASELILVPLLTGWSVGFFVSVTSPVRALKRKSERELYVYAGNAMGASTAFLLINIHDLQNALSMLFLVASSSVVIPWVWFNKVWK